MSKEENRVKIRNIALNGIMLALILSLQMVNLPNLITGIIINAIFVFITLYIGIGSAIILCLLSPLGAMLSGHVAAPMYPILPIIALGNIVLVILFNKFKTNKFWLRGIIPALVKAILIGCFGWLIVNFLISDKLTNWVVLPVLGVQFFTAVPGVWLGEKLKEKIK